MVGNGFDLNLGLMTSYRDFYVYYLSKERSINDSGLISALKTNLKSDLDNWSDLELALGSYTKELFNIEECYECYSNVTDALCNYLSQTSILDNNPDWKKLKLESEEFPNTIMRCLRDTHRDIHTDLACEVFDKHFKEINFINFNYTDSLKLLFAPYFEKHIKLKFHPFSRIMDPRVISGKHQNNLTNIHGTLRQGMILGLNDKSQLGIAEKLGSSEEGRMFTKSYMNSMNYPTSNEQHCMEQLEQSDFIFIYGMSLGASDKIWWDKVADLLLTTRVHVIIDVYCNPEVAIKYYSRAAEDRAYYKEKTAIARTNVIELLFQGKNYKIEELNRLHVILNSEIFDFYKDIQHLENLPQKQWEVW